MENEPIVANLLLKTWTGDVGGIFDYSTKSFQTVKDIIVESTYVVRNKNNFSIDNKPQHSDIQKDEELLFHVLIDINNKYSLYNPIPKHFKLNNENCDYLNNKIWYVIKSEDPNDDDNCNEEYSLSENDIIKFGKIKFVVQKIYLENENDDPATPMGNPKNYNISELNKKCPPVFEAFNVNLEKIKDEEKCDFCKMKKRNIGGVEETHIENDDTLIYLCNCKNKKFFHLSCLINANSNSNKNRGPIDYSITIDKFECPECQEQYPFQYKIEDKENDSEIKYVVDYRDKEPKYGDYMILESLDNKRKGVGLVEKYYKSIHIIKLNKLNNEYITFGREVDNDIVEEDISISRNHAIFCYNKNEGKIYLKNKSKKFGTSVLVKKGFNLLDKKIHLQVGRTYIEAYRGIKEIKND